MRRVALLHGSSVGGARPKALLTDGGCNLIAKFSSLTDRYSVVKGEYADRYFLAATIVHEYANDLHCELAEMHADDVHARKLLSESAAVVLKQMPRLARELRSVEREWEEQELLDPAQAGRTAHSLGARWADLAPELARFVPSRMRSWPSWRSLSTAQAVVDGPQATRRSAAACS
jgi:hypothetical protein